MSREVTRKQTVDRGDRNKNVVIFAPCKLEEEEAGKRAYGERQERERKRRHGNLSLPRSSMLSLRLESRFPTLSVTSQGITHPGRRIFRWQMNTEPPPTAYPFLHSLDVDMRLRLLR